MRDLELDAEGKDIVRAMLEMRSEYNAANNSKARKEGTGGS